MQPIAAIPPYDPFLVQGLVGEECKYGSCHARIETVYFINEDTVYVDLQTGPKTKERIAGQFYWTTGVTYPLDKLRFPKHCNDPLICATFRAWRMAEKSLILRPKCTPTNAT